MTVPGDVKLEVAESPMIIESHAGAPALGWFRLLQILLLGLTIAGVVVGVRIVVPGGMDPVNGVAFGLTVVWALVGFIDTHARDRSGTKVSAYHVLAGFDALVAMVALTAGRQAETLHSSQAARDVATIAAVLVTAISFHFLLALPDGRLHDSLRRGGASVVYVAAVGVGIGLVVAHQPFTVVDGAISWSIAALLALGPLRAR